MKALATVQFRVSMFSSLFLLLGKLRALVCFWVFVGVMGMVVLDLH